jgi:hypothetical protein
VITITETAEGRKIRGRSGTYPYVFGMTNGFSKGSEGRSEPRIGFLGAGD